MKYLIMLNLYFKKGNNSSIEDLKIMNSVLKNLLNLYFTAGLLNIEKITWDSPASLGENILNLKSCI
jgi:hypothetical protein